MVVEPLPVVVTVSVVGPPTSGAVPSFVSRRLSGAMRSRTVNSASGCTRNGPVWGAPSRTVTTGGSCRGKRPAPIAPVGQGGRDLRHHIHRRRQGRRGLRAELSLEGYRDLEEQDLDRRLALHLPGRGAGQAAAER